MIPEHLQHFQTNPIPVLDQGHVQLVDILGDDMSVVNAARVSYGSGTKRVSEDRHLIRYLMRHHHTSPFEMCEIVLRIKIPMDAHRQLVRHRTASLNEISTRYSVVTNDAQHTPSHDWRRQATENKQGSSGYVDTWPEHLIHMQNLNIGEYLSEKEEELQSHAKAVYEERIALGVAREQARKDLPLSTYTELFWKCDLRNLLNFLQQRMDSHAQFEIRQYANAISEIVKLWVPWTWEAFDEYMLNSVTLSRTEAQALRTLLSEDSLQTLLSSSLLKKRELKEFESKLRRIMNHGI